MSLQFQRVMAGEYRCSTPKGNYSIWNSYGSWKTSFTPRYGVTKILPINWATLKAAKAAAERHARNLGPVRTAT